MDPEQLRRLERLEEKIDSLAGVITALREEVGRWLAVLPDPGTIKAKLGRRRMANAAADFLSEE